MEGCLFYIRAVTEKIVVLSELQKEGYNGESFSAAVKKAYAAHGPRQGTIPKLKAVLPLEKAREDAIEVVNAVKISLNGWTSKNNTRILPTLSGQSTSTVLLSRIIVGISTLPRK
jgi:hypothetical protein